MDYCGTGIGVTKCSCPGEFSDAQYAAENYSPAGAWTLRDGTLEPSRSDLIRRYNEQDEGSGSVFE